VKKNQKALDTLPHNKISSTEQCFGCF